MEKLAWAQWIDKFTMHLSRLQVRAEPDMLAAMAAELYPSLKDMGPVAAAQAEYDEWPPHDD